MTETASPTRLTTTHGAALYIGALIGPALLLLPGLAAAEAGPASIIAWAGLLALSALFAVVFGALGGRFGSAGGVIGYVRAGLGGRASAVAGWSFLAGVVVGAPVFCLIGAGYVTGLTGGGTLTRALIGTLLLAAVLALAAGGLRTSATAQLLLVALLVVVVVVAAAGSVRADHAANWTPFAPHGWQAIGHAASTLLLSFVGWEAAAPLTTRFADPARQLPRIIGIALAVTTVLYLGLAVATISALGTGAGTSAPLAALLRDATGPAGTAAAAVAAVVLTLGSVNAYVTGAGEMTRTLTRRAPGQAATDTAPPVGRVVSGAHVDTNAGAVTDTEAVTVASAGNRAGDRPAPRFIAAVAVTGLAEIVAYGAGVISPAALVALPAALFLVVYLGCMASAVRVLRGPARRAAGPATVLVAVVLAFCGWAVLAPLAVALAVCSWPRLRRAAAARARGRAGRAGGLPARAGPRPAPGEAAAAQLGHNSADSAVDLECQTYGVA